MPIALECWNNALNFARHTISSVSMILRNFLRQLKKELSNSLKILKKHNFQKLLRMTFAHTTLSLVFRMVALKKRQLLIMQILLLNLLIRTFFATARSRHRNCANTIISLVTAMRNTSQQFITKLLTNSMTQPTAIRENQKNKSHNKL
jgi:hypothetical protein